MAYETEHSRQGLPHQIVLEDREELTITGVEEVESFDESSIVLSTVRGGLEVQGEGLHIERLSLDGGDLKVELEAGARRFGGDGVGLGAQVVDAGVGLARDPRRVAARAERRPLAGHDDRAHGPVRERGLPFELVEEIVGEAPAAEEQP